MARNLALLAVSTLIVSACASTLREYPRIPEGSGQPLVLLGTITGFTHLAQLQECSENKPDEDGLISVCIDPAPFELHIDVERTIYGSSRASQIHAATIAHWGTQHYRPLNGDKYLFYVVTDGKSFVVPRYHSEILQPDVNGRFAVPLWWGDALWWLPCGIESLREKITFADSAAKPIEDVPESLLEDKPEHLIVNSDRMIPTTGIYVSAIRDYLAKVRPTTSTMRCAKKEE
jgi:hypothetical protein